MREDSSEDYGEKAEQTCGSEQGQREDEGKSETHGMKPRREAYSRRGAKEGAWTDWGNARICGLNQFWGETARPPVGRCQGEKLPVCDGLT